MLIDEYKALSSRNDFFMDPEQQKTINSFQELAFNDNVKLT